MAFDLSSSGKGRRLVSDINVTPLVDVMLVLLIIFMIAAPMMTQGVDVDLPETTARPLRQSEAPVTITIDRAGEIHLDDVAVSRQLLGQQLIELARRHGLEQTILLRADREVPYGLVAAVMADIKEAGFNQLGMITQPPIRQ